MTRVPLPTRRRNETSVSLRALLDYNSETGLMYWKTRPAEMFKSSQQVAHAASWNSRFSGKLAFTAFDAYGYRIGAIFNVLHKAHRVAFAIHYGRWPVEQIDHVNGDPADNRIVNIREATNKENQRNRGIRSTNTSGCTGVCWHKLSGKWHARAQGSDGSGKHLGLFDSFDDAVAAREAYASVAYGQFFKTSNVFEVSK